MSNTKYISQAIQGIMNPMLKLFQFKYKKTIPNFTMYLFHGRQTRLQIENILLSFCRYFTKVLNVNILTKLFNFGRQIPISTKVNHIYTVMH
ncbi:hypothetical protein VIGAN_08047400 [Vigna angularis var. angularis]|uniref:Uncharacterized protein n=1 Tax=Vigna angularis var. angularis TaxID=157739 RepID=A0A0S3SMA2_PHAAN|nr:hypothetical protein VIGAN_08047400 [Vigna angularis var. angularis]